MLAHGSWFPGENRTVWHGKGSKAPMVSHGPKSPGPSGY